MGGKEVEMDSIAIKDDALVECLQKIANDRTNPRIEAKGAEMEGGTTLSVKQYEHWGHLTRIFV